MSGKLVVASRGVGPWQVVVVRGGNRDGVKVEMQCPECDSANPGHLHGGVAVFVRCGLSSAMIPHGDDYFSSGMPFSIVPDSFRDLT